MNRANPFVAELLERSAAGYAGFATGLLLERVPEIVDAYGADAFTTWKAHMTQRVIELAAALAAGESRLFAARIAWTRKAFIARERNADHLRASLEALRDVLAEHLPGEATSECRGFIDAAIDSLRDPDVGLDESELDPEAPHDKIALRYLQQVLEGNVADAISTVQKAARNGLDHAGVYLEVLLPAQREIGRLWHLGDVTVAEEHLVSATTQRSMAVLANTAPGVAPNGKTVVSAAVAGNAHDIGLRAVADLYQLAGWRSIFVGSDVPTGDLPGTLTFFEADLLLLGATLSTQIQKVAETIRVVRDRCERNVKIVVGGSAFDEAPDLWQRVGGDGYSPTVDGAVAVGARLVGLSSAGLH